VILAEIPGHVLALRACSLIAPNHKFVIEHSTAYNGIRALQAISCSSIQLPY
jgi:hypothetical protein